ncbi:MAG: fibrobacter succinogenes major paralogous domain-containing protein [Chitinophagaceae bacterium]|nr:fibrobacter succinogenes major paralogous domain-containing protein [Chitinophagaceae bacterium]
MQNIKILFFGFMLLCALFLFSCKKDKEDRDDQPIPGGGITDIDGNHYKTIIIDGQEWMTENLRTTKYNDGKAIPTGLSDAAWSSTTIGAYAVLNNDNANDIAYGKLYNWYAVNTGKLAPAGWHVATDADWQGLIDYLGGDDIAGPKLKSNTGWLNWSGGPATNTTNSSGFSALPASARDFTGPYINGTTYGAGYWTNFWSATEYGPPNAWYRRLGFSEDKALRYNFDKKAGFSVRCKKN